MSFGEKLAKLRKEKGISQEELAQELNVSRQAVSKWESNNSYPETDKIIQLCKLFNTSMDELIGLKDSPKKSNNKYLNVFNKYVELFINGIKMFYSMTFKQKLKCLIEMFFYGVCLIILYFTIGSIILHIVYLSLSILPNEILFALIHILEGILCLISLVTGVFILVKLYKIRYLDYYDDIILNNNLGTPKVEINNKEKINLKEEKIIIRDSNNDFNPFNWFKKIFVLCSKLFVLFLILPLAICFIFLLAAIIFVLYFIKNGIILFYLAIGLFGGLLMAFIILELLIKYVFSINIKPKRLLWMFMISLVIIAISSGLFLGELSSYKLINNTDYYEKDYKQTINMNNNIVIDYLDNYNTEIVYEDRDDILVEFYVYNSDFININSHKNDYNTGFEEYNYTIYSYYEDYNFDNKSFNDYINAFLKHVKNKEIVVNDYDTKVKIHISENNYKILRDNAKYLRYIGE